MAPADLTEFMRFGQLIMGELFDGLEHPEPGVTFDVALLDQSLIDDLLESREDIAFETRPAYLLDLVEMGATVENG